MQTTIPYLASLHLHTQSCIITCRYLLVLDVRIEYDDWDPIEAYACRSCFMSAYLSEESQRPFTLLMTFNNHFSISYLRNTLSFCRWCLKHLLFGFTAERQRGITCTGSQIFYGSTCWLDDICSSHPILVLDRTLSTTPIDFSVKERHLSSVACPCFIGRTPLPTFIGKPCQPIEST